MKKYEIPVIEIVNLISDENLAGDNEQGLLSTEKGGDFS